MDADAGSFTQPFASAGPAVRAGGNPRPLLPARTAASALAAIALAAVLTLSGRVTLPAPRLATPSLPASAGSGWQSVPVPAQLAISRALGADDRGFWVNRAGSTFTAGNARQRLSARFTAAAVVLASPAGSLTLSLRGLAGARGAAVTPTAHANRVTYARGALSEWYANGPLGLEQGFRVTRPVGGNPEALTLSLRLGGSLRARLQPDGKGLWLIARDGRTALRYDHLSASDGSGRALRASMSLRRGEVLISVDTAGARYPLSIDPIVEEAQLSASNGGVEQGMGTSVAIDGPTIAVGASGAKVNGDPQAEGAVYVFTEPASGWADATQSAELAASNAGAGDENNVYGDALGSSVAVSGATIVAGAPRATAGGITFAGALYVFEKPAGGWVNSYQTAELAALDATKYNYLGTSVATDGQTVVAGDEDALGSGQGLPGAGELYVFAEPVSGWSSETQTAKLTASGGAGEASGALGASVAVAGSTIVGGAPYTTVAGQTAKGALYLYTEPGAGGWKDATQSARLTASQGVAYETLGGSVAIDGETIAAGAPNDENPGSAPSAAYVFKKPVAGWSNTTQPLARLTPSEPLSGEHFGGSVGISGATVVVGAQFAKFAGVSAKGAVYLYSEPAGGWVGSSAPTTELSALEGNVQQAGAVAVSGSEIVESAPYASAQGHAYQGAAYVFGAGGAKTAPGEPTPKKEPGKENTFITPTGNTTLNYTSTAPPAPPRETFVGFPLNVEPGQPIACIGNVCTYAATCRTPHEVCLGSATVEEISGALAANASVKAKGKKQRKARVYGKSSFSIPAGHAGRITIRLNALGHRVLATKKKLRVRLTLATKAPGGKTLLSTKTVTIKLKQARKHR